MKGWALSVTKLHFRLLNSRFWSHARRKHCSARSSFHTMLLSQWGQTVSRQAKDIGKQQHLPQRAGDLWAPRSMQGRVLLCSSRAQSVKIQQPSCSRELSGTLISDDGTQHRKSRGGRAWERLITPCLLGSDSLKDELFPTWLLKNTY